MKIKLRTAYLFSVILMISLLGGTNVFASNEETTYTVISFDGMRPDFVEQYSEEGVMPNFKKVQENGLVAEDIRTIYPSLTAASHAAISTGATPKKTGMISNHLRLPDKKLTDKKSAFFSPLDASPIWFEAKEQGQTTATVLFPGSNPTEGYEATYGVYYGTTWAEREFEPLTFTTPVDWTALPESYSPAKEAMTTIKLKDAPNQKIFIIATDSIDDSTIAYNTFHFYTEKNGPVVETVTEKEWGSIALAIGTDHLAGFYFKLKDVDETLANAALYRTDVTSAVVNGPAQFQDNIASKFGFLPVEYDDHALGEEWITRSEYEEIHERFAKWTTDVSLYIKEAYNPDLLFMYYPQVDHEEHKYLLVDPRQQGYTKKKAAQYKEYITWSYELADRKLGEVLQVIDDKDRLLLVSDHGMEPVHTMIGPNHELEKAGLLVKDENGKIDDHKSKAFAVASGSIAHIYINVEGREKNGIVSEKEYPEIQQEIKTIFEDFKVEKPSFINRVKYVFHRWREKMVNGDDRSLLDVLIGSTEKPFEQIVIKGEEKEDLEILQHEQAGDVLLIAKRGYYISQDDESVVKEAEDYGSHGGNPERRELRPILYVMGNEYTQGRIQQEISTLDIAPTLYELMSLDTPDFIDGHVIDEMIPVKRNEQ